MSPAPEGAVIGLEVHARLATATKLFCGCAVDASAPPNRHVCPVCLGLPGSLPRLNGAAVERGVTTALVLGCTVRERSGFARKSYFYPDLPKGYQITQLPPLAEGGELPLERGGRPIRIRSVHLEEDTGRSWHAAPRGDTLLDFGRAGVPLVEIVTEPDLRSPVEARDFLNRLRLLLRDADVSTCAMEEGGLRVDVNVSLVGRGGGRTEIKNLGSFAAVERALEAEIARQRRLRAGGRPVRPVTLLWEPGSGELRPMRDKRPAGDYGYLSDPDLPEVVVTRELVDRVRSELSAPPWQRARRLARDHGIDDAAAALLARDRDLEDYFVRVIAAGAPARAAATWILGELRALSNARGTPPERPDLSPAALAGLLRLAAERRLPRPLARRILAGMLDTGAGALEIAERLEGRAAGEAAVARWVAEAIDLHPAEATRLRAGEERLVDFFVGRVMRISGGRADPVRVAELVRAVAAP